MFIYGKSRIIAALIILHSSQTVALDASECGIQQFFFVRVPGTKPAAVCSYTYMTKLKDHQNFEHFGVIEKMW